MICPKSSEKDFVEFFSLNFKFFSFSKTSIEADGSLGEQNNPYF